MYKVVLVHPLYHENTTPIFSFTASNLDIKQDCIIVEAEDAIPINKKLAIPLSNIKVLIEL
jgi:hypothetical protein